MYTLNDITAVMYQQTIGIEMLKQCSLTKKLECVLQAKHKDVQRYKPHLSGSCLLPLYFLINVNLKLNAEPLLEDKLFSRTCFCSIKII